MERWSSRFLHNRKIHLNLWSWLWRRFKRLNIFETIWFFKEAWYQSSLMLLTNLPIESRPYSSFKKIIIIHISSERFYSKRVLTSLEYCEWHSHTVIRKQDSWGSHRVCGYQTVQRPSNGRLLLQRLYFQLIVIQPRSLIFDLTITVRF